MPRTKNARNISAPKYRFHKGQAVVTLNGKVKYLGKFNSAKSKERYNRLISRRSLKAVIPRAKVQSSSSNLSVWPTVAELAVAYASHCQGYYQKGGEPSSEWTVARAALRRLRALFGQLSSAEFGHLRFIEYRESLIARILDDILDDVIPDFGDDEEEDDNDGGGGGVDDDVIIINVDFDIDIYDYNDIA